MENREISEMLQQFEQVWQRVSPPSAEYSAMQQSCRTSPPATEPCTDRTPRWFRPL